MFLLTCFTLRRVSSNVRRLLQGIFASKRSTPVFISHTFVAITGAINQEALAGFANEEFLNRGPHLKSLSRLAKIFYNFACFRS